MYRRVWRQTRILSSACAPNNRRFHKDGRFPSHSVQRTLCHCERSVAISRKGIREKAMMRCFCLWQKRCACGAMCAFGTFRSAGRVRLRSSVRFLLKRTDSPPYIQKQPRLRLFFGVPGGSRKERRDAIAKRRCLHRKRSVSREGSTAKQCAFFVKTHGLPPLYTKTTAVAVVFWCTRGESNPRHPASEAGALSN